MKYPKFNKKPMDTINQERFDRIYKTILEQIEFDNRENNMELSKGDIEMIAWNCATRIICVPF